MKAYLINILMFIGVFLCYKLGVFNSFSGLGLKIAAFILIAILFVVGFFVFGNPFGGGSDDENK